MLLQELPNLDLLNKANAELRQLWYPSNRKQMHRWLQVARDTLQQLGINVVSFDKATIKISKPLYARFLEVQGIHKSGIPSCEELSNKDVFMDILEMRAPQLSKKRARPAMEDCLLRILGYLTQRAISGKEPSRISGGFLKSFLGISNGKTRRLILDELEVRFRKFLEIRHRYISLGPEAGINIVKGSNSDPIKHMAETELVSVELHHPKQKNLAQVSQMLGYCERDCFGAMVLSDLKTMQNFLCSEGYKSLKGLLSAKDLAEEVLEKTWAGLDSDADSRKKSNDFENLKRIHPIIQEGEVIGLANKTGDARIYHPLVNISKRVRNAMFVNILDDVDISACFPSILPVLVKEHLMERGEYEEKKEAFISEFNRWKSYQDPYLMPFLHKGFDQPDREKGKKILNTILNAPVSFGNGEIGCVLAEFKKVHPIFTSAIISFYKNQKLNPKGIFYYRAAKWEQIIVTHLQKELYRKGICTVNFHDGFMMKKGLANIDEIQSLLDLFIVQTGLDIKLKIKIK